MGAWGIQLPENDVYADINAFYTALLRYGMNDQEALKHTLNEFSAYKNDPEDGDLLWLSLADILWNLGRLDELAPKHLTWKFFEKHVIGRYLGWTQGINIFA